METLIGSSATSTEEKLRRRLLGVTATGPLFEQEQKFVVVPVVSAIRLIAEVGRRVVDPEAAVVSTVAEGVRGDSAYRLWLAQSTSFGVSLSSADPRTRIRVLSDIYRVARGNGSIVGLESVMSSAVNAAWPWLTASTTERLAKYVTVNAARSPLATVRAIVVVDPCTRIAGLLAPGELGELDVGEWMNERLIEDDAYISGIPGVGPRGNPMAGNSANDRVDDATGSGGDPMQSADDLLHGNDSSGVPGGLADFGDLPGNG